MRLISIVGARPQFIKLAPLYEETWKEGIEHIVINSGQHYDYEMASIFFEEYNLKKPDYNLGVGSGTHAYQIGTTMIRTEKILNKISNKNDIVIVYGDTNTTLGAAIASAKLKLDVAHVEAGVREGDIFDVPEELNRILTDHISTILFPPTKDAEMNLIHEGITNNVFLVGDIMVDALEITKRDLPKKNPADMKKNSYVLLTLHRPRNVDNKIVLNRIINSLSKVELPFVLPLHPRTKRKIEEFGLSLPSNIKLINPQNHRNFVKLILDSRFVVTDSGGTPKEAFLLKKRSIILRHVTGWKDLIINKSAKLIDPKSKNFEKIFLNAIKTIDEWETKWSPNPFGKKGVSRRMLKVLSDVKEKDH